MKISCQVEISNRLLPSLGKRKHGVAKSQIAVGRKPASADKTIYVMIYSAQKPNGQIYKLHNNVEAIFTKFLSEGKASVRLKSPPEDILISQAKPENLKAFLMMMKSVILKGTIDNEDANSESSPLRLTTLSAAESKKELNNMKTSLVVLEKSKYPVLEGFPISLTHLSINNCNLKKFDSRIVRCKSLTHLDLSGNRLICVPFELSEFKQLAHATFKDNLIEHVPEALCRQGALTQTLIFLDVSGNPTLRRLPVGIHNFGKLHTLKLDLCSIEHLPSRFGHLSSLRHLSISENNLTTLPYSFVKLHLDELNLYKNPFQTANIMKNKLSVPTLLELTARSMAKHRISSADLNSDIQSFLASVKWCPCGEPCFVSFSMFLQQRDLRSLVTSTCHQIDQRGRTSAPIETFLCSRRCVRLYEENPRRLRWK